MSITISDIEDIGNGQKQCRVVLSRGIQTESGYVPDGEYYPFVISKTDPYGLSPLICAILAKGDMQRE